MNRFGRAGHTLMFVALSFILSAVLHIIALIVFSKMEFQFADPRLKRVQKEIQRFSLQEIRKVFSKVVPRTIGEGEGRGGEQGDRTGEFSRDVPEEMLSAESEGDGSLVGSDSATLDHEQSKESKEWEPRREILSISESVIGKDFVQENRRLIPDIARAPSASDIIYPVLPSQLGRRPSRLSIGGAEEMDNSIPGRPRLELPGDRPEVQIPREDLTPASESIDEKDEKERQVEALDDVLSAELSVYKPLFGSDSAYFRLEVKRRGKEFLPVLPKDVVFVQDSSASMAEQRLHFCRDGLASSLEMLDKSDRFNVISFSDRPVACFDKWATPTGGALEKAKRYAANLRSAGNTDILASLKALEDLEVEQGRPCIAFLVTDGLATTGIVESAGIIREFTRANEGKVSVFTMGTKSGANMYLLDMLSYCNGGATHVVKGGRWSIREDYTNQVHAFSRPVLSNLRVAFAGRGVEAFPSTVQHLYMDDPLVLYGRIPKDMKRVTFHALGAAGEKRCDMIFDISLDEEAEKGSQDIRDDWALQKAYHLIGEISRKNRKEDRHALKKLAEDYKLKIPYADKI